MTQHPFDPAAIHPHTLALALQFVGGLAALRQLQERDTDLATDLAAIAPPAGAVFDAGQPMTDDIEEFRR